MAEIPVVRLKVEMDQDKVDALNQAIQNFREKAEELDTATLKVRDAMYAMQDALTVKRE